MPCLYVYSQKQLIEGYQNSFVFITFGNIIFKQSIFVNDRTITVCNSPKYKLNFKGHWLGYSTTPNVPSLSTQSSQAKNVALTIFGATFY